MQNFIKTIINGVQNWTKKEIKDNIKNSTADWNQNNENAADYVKNRTHWEEEEKVVLVDNLTYEDYNNEDHPKCTFVIGKKYDVIWNGTLYKDLVCHYEDEWRVIASRENGCPFYIDDDGGDDLYISSNNGEDWTVSIRAGQLVIHKLDSKYLDLPTNLATTDDVQEAVDVANNKMDINNPVGTGSFSMNRKAGTTVGDYSHAEGQETTASGTNSHAEGKSTIASGLHSHAEGSGTTASGINSHAEGNGTVASRSSQHVQGRHNIIDTENSESSEGKYAHIVGNGHSMANRSNAHTLDWNGVGWFQGGLQVGGNAQDDGAKSVLLEGDAIPIPENATVGQTIAVKSVDENGKPVEWEATDFSASGGSGCIASDIAPEDTSVLWIDTADNSDDTLQDAVNIALAQAKESGEFKGDPGKTPEKGVDYYTDTDKAELVSAVLSALPAWTGGSY